MLRMMRMMMMMFADKKKFSNDIFQGLKSFYIRMCDIAEAAL